VHVVVSLPAAERTPLHFVMVCGRIDTEDHRFAVREGNELLPGAAMARDQKGVMCDRATYGAYINLSLSSQP
jgi:hypothetical protein